MEFLCLGLLIKHTEITGLTWNEWSMPGAEIRGLRNKVNAILYYALGEVWNICVGIEAVEN